MDKQKLFNVLKSLKIEESKEDEYGRLKRFGIQYAFNHLTEEEAIFVSKYIRRYPHIYYNRFLKHHKKN